MESSMEKAQLEQYVNLYGKDIFSFCMMLTKNRQEAEDLYQDIFLKAIELDKINHDNNPKSYLLNIAVNLWKNRKRKFAWRSRIAKISFLSEESQIEQIPDEEQAVDEKVIKKQEQQLVRQLVKRLPEKLEIVILLYYMEEQPVENIAAILGIPQGTVKSRLYQARKKLEKEMEANESWNGILMNY